MLQLKNKYLSVRVSPVGGSLVDAYYHNGQAFLRPYTGTADRYQPLNAASFPLLPLCNRVAESRFSFQGSDYYLQPNNRLHDAMYIHGDGWLAHWDVVNHKVDSITLFYKHGASDNSPYSYRAKQVFSLQKNALVMCLELENTGGFSLPFGLGFHPFFPRTEKTLLQAAADRWWTINSEHISCDQVPIPDDRDFTISKKLPSALIDNCYGNWNQSASIILPENELAIEMACTEILSHFLLYAPQNKSDFFCFEPMSHVPNGINHRDLGGMTVLQSGEIMQAGMTISVTDLK